MKLFTNIFIDVLIGDAISIMPVWVCGLSIASTSVRQQSQMAAIVRVNKVLLIPFRTVKFS